MNTDFFYIYKDCERLILLVRGCEDSEQRSDYLDELTTNITEMKELFDERKEK